MVTRDAGEAAPLCPTTIPVHDHSYVEGDFSGLEETVLELFVVSRCLFERQFFPFFTVNSGVIKNLTIFAYKVKEKFGRPKRIGEMS